MKKHLFTTIAAGLLLLTACSQDELPANLANNQQPDGSTTRTPVTVTAGIDTPPQTRIAYGEKGATTTKVNWSAGAEQFSLLYAGATAESYLFVKPAGNNPVASAEFTCAAAPVIAEETPLYAVYPGSADLMANATTITMDLSQQPGTQDALNRNHLMVATGDAPADLSDLKLSFEHKVAVVKLTLSSSNFAEGTVVSGITLTATGLVNKGEYHLGTSGWSDASDAENTITATSGATVDAGGKVTVYLTLIPGNLSGVTITASHGGRNYTGTLGDRAVVAGSIYDAEAEVTTADEKASMQFTIRTTAGGQEFVFPFKYSDISGYTLSVNWGEGGGGTTDIASDDDLKHTYATAGEYTITLSSGETDVTKEQMPKWDFGETGTASLLISMDTPMLFMDEPYLSYAFYGCTNLEKLSPNLFVCNTSIEKFTSTFSLCTALTEIPAVLFEKNLAVIDFKNCFEDCTGLTKIPGDLFAKNIAAANFSSCFRSCTDLTEIPADLFAKNIAASNFSHCFRDCSGLTEIPAGLFAKNTAAISFNYCFARCKKAKLNPYIFWNADNEDWKNRFAGREMNFSFCFSECGEDDDVIDGGIAPELWECSYEVTDGSSTSCFDGCTKVTNYDVIPGDWKL